MSDSTDLLRYISSFLLFSLLKREGFGGEMGTRLIPIFFKVDQRLLDIVVTVSLTDHWRFPK